MKLVYRIKAAAEIHGDFVLRSGKKSNLYFDKYRFESDPLLLNDVTKEMVSLVPGDIDVLCGLEMGGIPIVTMLSHHTKLPAAFIRKMPKEHGTCKYAEGIDLVGKKIVLVEDVVSSGGAIIDAVRMLRDDGIHVERAICVIDRETGGKENLAKIGISLISLLRAEELNETTQQERDPESISRPSDR